MDDSTDADLLLAAVRSEIAKMHTALPGRIVSYDHATQRATIALGVKQKIRAARGGAITHVETPAIPNVPIMFPTGSGYAITWPLAAGDPVLVIFAERSIDEWKAGGNSASEAQDVRRFDLSDAIAIPGSVSPAQPIGATGRDAAALVVLAPLIKLGSSSATMFVALASLVLDRLTAIVNAYNTHTHTTGVGPSGIPITLLGAPASVAATKTQAE